MKSMIFLLCCAHFSQAHKDRQPNAAFADDHNLIVAHRGLRSLHLENTLLALTQAFEYGADGVEFDVQLSRDLEPMVFHDRELARLVHVDANIDELSLAELAQLKQSSDAYAQEYPISTLAEVLRSMPPNKMINVELKETTGMRGLEGMRSVLRVMEPFKHTLNIVVSSFEPDILRMVSELDADYPLGFLIDRESTLVAYLSGLKIVDKVDFINPHIDLLSRFTSKKIKELGVKLILWGHKEIGEEDIFMADGHTALISDIPSELLRRYRP